MANQPKLSPENKFPTEALAESVQVPPDPYTGAASALTLTLNIAAAGDAIMKWGTNVRRRDQQLREFWPTESYLAGAVKTTAFRNSTFDWEVRGGGERVEQAVTDMLHTAIAHDQIGWMPFVKKISQDLYCLHGKSTVTLGGSRFGKKKTIQKIVEERDEGPVLSIDSNGQVVERKIIQWEKTPLGGRSWVWISLKNASFHGGGKQGGLWITEDHPVLTDNGWVNAGDVKVGMSVASGHPEPNLEQCKLLTGMLLGDAAISVPGKNAQIKLSHSIKQEEYMLLKMKAFSGMSWTPVNGGEIKQANSQVSLYLNKWREIWYPSGKKEVPRLLVDRGFSPIMLAAWYMDDGSLSINKTKNGKITSPSAFISSQGFTKEDNEWLAELLTSNGIETSAQSIKIRGKTAYRLYINTEGAKVLFSMISKYVPGSMRYKIPEGYDEYDEGCWNIGCVEPAFDTVVAAERKTLKTGRGYEVQTTYHIGVEETKNFIANNVVVHNTQDNGCFIELIRDPGRDAASKFKGAMAPVIGIAQLDAAQCVRTGNPEYPVLYTDRDGGEHKLAWYQVVAMSDLPSASEKMNGVGYCSVTCALRLAQIMRSIAMFKDEEVGGRNIKRINLVGGVGQQQIKDAIARTHEEASNKGFSRYIEHTVLASLDPEKPVSVAEVNLASLPEGFDFDQEMQWYISGLALDFGVDYQEFAPLPGGNIGSASQSMILHRKSSGKGPRSWMDSISEAFTVYGVMPRGTELVFNDKDEQEELEKQEVRTAALEEAAIAARSKIFPRKYIAQNLVERGLFPDIGDIPEEFWNDDVQIETRNPVGQTGGNTLREDASRTDSGKERAKVGDRLRKLFGG